MPANKKYSPLSCTCGMYVCMYVKRLQRWISAHGTAFYSTPYISINEETRSADILLSLKY